MLVTYALLPVIRRFADPAGVNVELSDISMLTQFPESLSDAQRVSLGELCTTPEPPHGHRRSPRPANHRNQQSGDNGGTLLMGAYAPRTRR